MIDINVYLPIDNENENRWAAVWGINDPVVFSVDSVRNIIESNPEENDFRLNFNCDGGSVAEGLMIYDYLRTSGKNIYCNVEGGCHSMAIVLLLAAPKENRSANPNCRALIHKVRTCFVDGTTADELEKAAEDIRREQNAILDIYADRTGTDRETLENLMNEEKMRTASELLQYGFISKINQYNTNKKNTNAKMSELQETTTLLQKVVNSLKKLKNVLGEEIVNFDHTDADGNIIFTTEAEDDTLEIGMGATPDGTFELPNGKVVTIADGVITDITEAEEAPEEKEEETEENEDSKEEETVNEETNETDAINEVVDEEKESLKAEVETLKNEIETLKAALAESKNLIEDCKKQICTNHKPSQANRNNTPKDPVERNVKAEVMEKLNKVNK